MRPAGRAGFSTSCERSEGRDQMYSDDVTVIIVLLILILLAVTGHLHL